MTLEHIKLQYDRLKRHYNLALNDKDQISLLDLSHSLRIWVDMKSEIDEMLVKKRIKLELSNVVKDKKLKQVLKGAKYKYLPIGYGVDSPNIQIKGLTIINKSLDEDEIKKIYEAGPPRIQKSKLTFGEWLNSSIYQVPSIEENHPHITISREIIIKRVANILGASHPQNTKVCKDNNENKFDPYIKELYKVNIADYPATYYQLLEIAQEILNKVKIIFE